MRNFYRIIEVQILDASKNTPRKEKEKKRWSTARVDRRNAIVLSGLHELSVKMFTISFRF
jgi:hypothetical protein